MIQRSWKKVVANDNSFIIWAVIKVDHRKIMQNSNHNFVWSLKFERKKIN